LCAKSKIEKQQGIEFCFGFCCKILDKEDGFLWIFKKKYFFFKKFFYFCSLQFFFLFSPFALYLLLSIILERRGRGREREREKDREKKKKKGKFF
jgi:hypothetical protein